MGFYSFILHKQNTTITFSVEQNERELFFCGAIADSGLF